MKDVKPMYRPHTILARTISIELTLRRSSSEIAAVNRDPSRGTKLDSIQQLIRDSLRPLSKRRFFSSSIPADTGFSESFQGTDQGIATWCHDWLTPAIVSVLHMLTEVGSGKSIEIVLFALVLFFMWKRWSHLS
jgi:hypothetical protein